MKIDKIRLGLTESFAKHVFPHFFDNEIILPKVGHHRSWW